MSWLPRWEPENEQFWRETGSRIAWRTLILTTITLILSFMTWFVMSAAVIRLPKIGFRFSSSELGWGWMSPGPPYWLFIVLALGLGMGGGDFSSYMPSTSLFFPKRLQGAALGIQAGVGNFGVSLGQFVTPWIIGFAAFGALAGPPQVF